MCLISRITPYLFGLEAISFSKTLLAAFSILLNSLNSRSLSLTTRSFSVVLSTLYGLLLIGYKSTFLNLLRPKVGSMPGYALPLFPPNFASSNPYKSFFKDSAEFACARFSRIGSYLEAPTEL